MKDASSFFQLRLTFYDRGQKFDAVEFRPTQAAGLNTIVITQYKKPKTKTRVATGVLDGHVQTNMHIS